MNKKIIARKVMERLANHNIRARERNKVWYQRYDELADLLDEKAPKAKILRAIDDMLDSAHCYGRRFIAVSAAESLDLVIKERGWRERSHR